ncbi:MAG: SDR family NAD(P)-dependent oxidoreductase [Chloroflexota bacterium]|nr:SDR family NAD(P)-dependent oxidoreductase [Chloroflexota bacterium]
MAKRLENKVVLITGTGGGQGRAAALLFAQEGAKIVGCDLKVEGNQETVQMVQDAGGEMVSLEPLDLGDADQVQQMVELTKKTYGRLDVLYNNASAVRFAPVVEMSWEDWDFTVRNELHLVFLMTRAAGPLMIESGGSSIINTASTAGMRALPGLGNFAHAATKGGVIGLTRQLAFEVAPHGIRANVIAPGLIKTPATEFLLKDPQASQMMLQKILLQRFGQPEDIAQTALFLASDESSYITGTVLVVDGGWTAW